MKRHTRSFVKGFKEMEELEQNLSTAVEVLSPVTSHWGGAIFTCVNKQQHFACCGQVVSSSLLS